MSEAEVRSQFVIGSYGTYAGVERAVAGLADGNYPVEKLAVVAHNLRLVRDSPEPARTAATLIDSAEIGALGGASLMLVFGMFNRDDPIAAGMILALLGFLIGALVGIAFGLVGHAVAKRGRHPISRSLAAARYEILARDVDDALRAAHLLSGAGSAGFTSPPHPGT
jgi:hypothetical protein